MDLENKTTLVKLVKEASPVREGSFISCVIPVTVFVYMTDSHLVTSLLYVNVLLILVFYCHMTGESKSSCSNPSIRGPFWDYPAHIHFLFFSFNKYSIFYLRVERDF